MADRGIAIAIIEDSREDRFFLRRALKKMVPGCSISEFAYVDEAIAFLKTPDRPMLAFIFVDINTPRKDGFDFADAYLDLYPELKAATKVFVMSTSINPDDMTRAEKHPAIDGFLAKPVSIEGLAPIIGTSAT